MYKSFYMTDSAKAIPIKVTSRQSENKCDLCTPSKCCTYITHAISTPRSVEDFDTLLWQLAHQDVQAYKDEGTWFLLFYTRCRFLHDDGRCQIYTTRPQVCRDYSNDYCEFDGPAEEGFELFFDTYEALLAYCRKRFKNWDNRFKKPAKSA